MASVWSFFRKVNSFFFLGKGAQVPVPLVDVPDSHAAHDV